MKVVINNCFGGFGLSNEAFELYMKKKGKQLFFYKHDYGSKNKDEYFKVKPSDRKSLFTMAFTKDFGDSFISPEFKPMQLQTEEYKEVWDCFVSDRDISRTDPILIEVIEELGKTANGICAELKIVEIPDDVLWEIDEYDGNETIREQHRSWL